VTPAIGYIARDVSARMASMRIVPSTAESSGRRNVAGQVEPASGLGARSRSTSVHDVRRVRAEFQVQI
jgi:hypothetical protein